tara:strand:- start:63827 stop:64129 length:303 start_codon:yes stop_codon:yes gene_type:complete
LQSALNELLFSGSGVAFYPGLQLQRDGFVCDFKNAFKLQRAFSSQRFGAAFDKATVLTNAPGRVVRNTRVQYALRGANYIHIPNCHELALHYLSLLYCRH